MDEQSHPIIAWLRVLKRSGKRSCHLIGSDVVTFLVKPKLLSWPLLTIKNEMNCVCVCVGGGLHVYTLYVCCMYCMCVACTVCVYEVCTNLASGRMNKGGVFIR